MTDRNNHAHYEEPLPVPDASFYLHCMFILKKGVDEQEAYKVGLPGWKESNPTVKDLVFRVLFKERKIIVMGLVDQSRCPRQNTNTPNLGCIIIMASFDHCATLFIFILGPLFQYYCRYF